MMMKPRVPASRASSNVKHPFSSNIYALELKVREQLAAAKVLDSPPCPLRKQIYDDAFEELIEMSPDLSSLLRQIKTEYDSTPVVDVDLVLRDAHEDLLVEHQKLQAELEHMTLEHHAVVKRVQKLEESVVVAETTISNKNLEIESLNKKVMNNNPVWKKHQQLYTVWTDLETDMEKVLQEALDYKAKLDAMSDAEKRVMLPTTTQSESRLRDRLRQLESEVLLARQRERDAYNILLDFKVEKGIIKRDEAESVRQKLSLELDGMYHNAIIIIM